MPKNIFNTELVELARRTVKAGGSNKNAFVDAATATGGGDPAAAGGMPPGGDPTAAAGGMPPGGDPMAAAGGAPPSDPRIDQLMSMMQQMMSSQGGAGAAGAGAAGGVEPIKPKIDVNVEIMRMNKMIARIADAMGIQIPASEMVATSNDLTQMATQGQGAAAGGAGAGGAPPTSAISPIAPMQPAMPAPPPGAGGSGGEKKSQARGTAVPQISSMRDLGNRAGALATILRSQLSQ